MVVGVDAVVQARAAYARRDRGVAAAGFITVRRAAVTPFNLVLEARC